MIRSGFSMLAVFLSVVMAGMPSHAANTARGKRRPAKRKAVRKHNTSHRAAQSEQPKQYGHVVLEDVHINAMGVQCTIKRVRLQYKGDGIDTNIAGSVLPAVKDELPSAAAYFISPEVKEPAELKRLAADDKKEVKVVLWTYMNLEPLEEFIQADRRLAEKLAEEIRRLSDENKEKVTIVKPNLVEQYKNRHPDWKSLEITQVGHDFDADYVICLEIDKLSLYEPKAYQQIYRGQTEILITVVDKKHPDEMQTKIFTDRYPAEARGDMTPFEMTPHAFRDQFLEHAAKRLAFYFVDHKRKTNANMEED